MNLAGQTLGTITSPVTDSPGSYSPEGFGLDPKDGSFWIPLTNSATVIHLDSHGNLLAPTPSDPTRTMPRWARMERSMLAWSSLARSRPSIPRPELSRTSPHRRPRSISPGASLATCGLATSPLARRNSTALVTCSRPSPTLARLLPSRLSPAISGTRTSSPPWSISTHPRAACSPRRTSRRTSPAWAYSATCLEKHQSRSQHLVLLVRTFPGQSATIALQSLNSSNVSFTLYNDQSDVLAVSSPGATNYTAGLNNFVAPDNGPITSRSPATSGPVQPGRDPRRAALSYDLCDTRLRLRHSRQQLLQRPASRQGQRCSGCHSELPCPRSASPRLARTQLLQHLSDRPQNGRLRHLNYQPQ